MTNVIDQAITGDYALYCGDNVEVIAGIPDNSIGLTVSSPPFPQMWTYTNSPRDAGNVRSIEEFANQFKFLAGELLRVTMPGRSCCLHVTQIPAFKGVDGYIGLKDFRGEVIRVMQAAGWIFYGEVTIDKDPQVKAIRTKDRGLLFKTLATNAEHLHMALADFLLQFRKPGDSPEPIRAGISSKYGNENGWITSEEWIEWAHPVWYGIRETDVLNVVQARETDDERHLCPLQLGAIERAVKLWSNPGDTVLDPYAGIGSTPYVAVKLGRLGVGMELKESYYRSAVENLNRAVAECQQRTLFDFAEVAP